MVDEVFRQKVRKHWTAAIWKTFGKTPDDWSGVEGAALIMRTISPFLYDHMAHAFLPDRGGADFEGVRFGVEDGTLEFQTAEKVFYVVRPKLLRFGYVRSAPEESFLLLDLERLEPSGMYEELRPCEELIESPVGSMEYIEPIHAIHGIIGYDDYGSEISLPADRRTIMRYLGGRVMVTSEVSLWNADKVCNNAYSTPHSNFSPEQIMKATEKIVGRRAPARD